MIISVPCMYVAMWLYSIVLMYIDLEEFNRSIASIPDVMLQGSNEFA